MAIIPLPQEITIQRKSKTPGPDGRPSFAAPVTLKGRVDETVKIVLDRNGAETLAMATITLDKLAQVDVGDRLTYTDELGRTRTFTAINIEPVRGLGGKALLTEVYAK